MELRDMIRIRCRVQQRITRLPSLATFKILKIQRTQPRTPMPLQMSTASYHLVQINQAMPWQTLEPQSMALRPVMVNTGAATRRWMSSGHLLSITA